MHLWPQLLLLLLDGLLHAAMALLLLSGADRCAGRQPLLYWWSPSKAARLKSWQLHNPGNGVLASSHSPDNHHHRGLDYNLHLVKFTSLCTLANSDCNH
jgi:hypothetical protein